MARSVYVAGLDPAAGKSLVALGIAELLSRRVGRLGVFRPLVEDAGNPLLELLRRRYAIDAEPDALYGVTYGEAAVMLAQGRAEELTATIVERYRALAAHCDAVVVIGGDMDHRGDLETHRAGPTRDSTFDAELAAEFGAAMIPVIDGRRGDVTDIVRAVGAARHAVREIGAEVLSTIVNRVPAERLDDLRAALGPPDHVIPDEPELTTPTVAEVADALHAKRFFGDETAMIRPVRGFVVGGATVPTFLDHVADGCLVIVPGDRADIIVAAYSAHAAGLVSLAGLVLTLGELPDRRTLRLLERLNAGLGMLGVPEDSFATITAAGRIQPRFTVDDPRKTEVALGLFEAAVDTADLADRIAIHRTSRVTPLMFEYELIERASANRRHVVLPEASDDRVLRAAESLLRRQVAELTLLGHPEEVGRRARELGLDVGAAMVVDPATSPWREEFAATYAKLRSHKGITLEQARDAVTDVNYFGTLMVETGRADAMVSGAAHTTAATIRPAFEIIRTVPGLTVASSVFFMCLADQVLVYGDCAINPDPDAEQLADIAISSADTAAQFEVEPRVAMLSYSTGTSGSGADVAKVAAATELVRKRRPDLPVEGPIQYDAAVDPSVAATKLPGSAVAGRATVLIFPDLNTGNNTYKAVQRSAHAVAIGPVLQGLRRPVNDLSRGATVRDIVNTVAITAIQAAAGSAGRPGVATAMPTRTPAPDGSPAAAATAAVGAAAVAAAVGPSAVGGATAILPGRPDAGGAAPDTTE